MEPVLQDDVTREITPQDIVEGLTYLREDVFTRENIEHVQDFVEGLERFGEKAAQVWKVLVTYVRERRQGDGNVRSLDLTRALHNAGLEEFYSQLEHYIE